jgi:hypothetical protein
LLSGSISDALAATSGNGKWRIPPEKDESPL